MGENLSGTFILPDTTGRFSDTRVTDIDKDTVLVEWKGDRTPRQVELFGGEIGHARDGQATLRNCDTPSCSYLRIRDGREMATVFWRGAEPDLQKILPILRSRSSNV